MQFSREDRGGWYFIGKRMGGGGGFMEKNTVLDLVNCSDNEFSCESSPPCCIPHLPLAVGPITRDILTFLDFVNLLLSA